MLLERNNNNYNNLNPTFSSNNFNRYNNQSFNYKNQRYQNNNYNNQNMIRSKSMTNSFRNRNNIINSPNPNFNFIRNQKSYNPNFQISNNENYANNYQNEQITNFNNENYNYNVNNENFQNPNSYNGYNKQNMEINRDMNNYFRSLLKSRGVHLSRGNSYQDIKEEENNRKKVYMENIKNQISLFKKTKLEELRKRENEDKQYLKDMINSYPFGRGGAGAPIRDKNGNVVAALRNLVTDPKYNLVQINVDDDYYDVWDKDKRYGLVNFRNKGYNGFINNFAKSMNFDNVNNRNDYFSQNLNNNNNRPLSTNPNRNYFNTINGNLNNNINQNNMNMNFSFNNNNNGRFIDVENNNNFNYMNSINYNNGNNQMNNLNVINEIPNQENQFYENSNIRNADLNISYDNYELTNETKRTTQQLYSDFLQNQIREKERKKYLEKLKKEEEDRKEEERLRRENEELKRRAEEERNLTKVKTITTTIKKVENKEEKKEEEKDYELEYLKKLDMESRLHLNNELVKLRDAIQEQELGLTKEIKLIKQETENANKDRNEASKKIEGLKNDLSVQRLEDEMRRKNVYDVIINENYPVYDFNDRKMDFYNNKDNLITKKLNEKFEGGFKTNSKLQTFGNYFDNDDYKFKYDISDEDYFLNDIKNKLGDKNSNKNIYENLNNEEIEEEKAKMNNIYNKNMDRLRKLKDYEKGKSSILDKDLNNYNIIEFNEDDYN